MQRGQIGESGETYAINRHGQLISESRFDEDLMRIGLIEETERSILNIDIRDPGVNLTRGEQSTLPRQEQPFDTHGQKRDGQGIRPRHARL